MSFRFPTPQIPAFKVLPKVLADCNKIAIVAYANNISLGKLYAKRNKYEIAPNQELLSYGLCNFITAFFRFIL